MINIMEPKSSRSYLETLPLADLLRLADTCAIDVPDNLDRNFLIAEIIEAASDFEKLEADDDIGIAEMESAAEKKIPEMYNATEIKMVLQSPVWAFVFWNISDADTQLLKKYPARSLFLRICSFSGRDAGAPCDSFEVQVSDATKEQYVLLPSGIRFVAAELSAHTPSGDVCLVGSKIVECPRSEFLRQKSSPGGHCELSEVMELSGARALLRKHYMSHRHLFS